MLKIIDIRIRSLQMLSNNGIFIAEKLRFPKKDRVSLILKILKHTTNILECNSEFSKHISYASKHFANVVIFSKIAYFI